LCAGLTDQIGPESALQLQAGLLAFATVSFALVRPPDPHGGSLQSRNPLREIADAWRETRASPALRSSLGIMLVIGLTLGGTYVPLITLITRDTYGGGSAELSFGLAAMMLGTTSGSIVLTIRGGIRRQGRGLLLGLGAAAAALGALALEPPFLGALGLAYLWGLFGAIGMVMTRTISQQHAPETHRARILSLYHLALTGAAPVGSVATGFAIDTLGASTAALVPAATLLGAVVVAWNTSALPRIESDSGRDSSSGTGTAGAAPDDQFSSVP